MKLREPIPFFERYKRTKLSRSWLMTPILSSQLSVASVLWVVPIGIAYYLGLRGFWFLVVTLFCFSMMILFGLFGMVSHEGPAVASLTDKELRGTKELKRTRAAREHKKRQTS